jgi:hypothetical protein
MNNILITSAGKRVSSNAFKKELKAVFPDKKVFATDYNHNFLLLA